MSMLIEASDEVKQKTAASHEPVPAVDATLALPIALPSMAGAKGVHPFVRIIWQLERARGTLRLPTGQLIGGALFYGRPLLSNLRTLLMQMLIYEPALRYRCRSVGRRLRLYGPAPRISGDGIIDIGDDVQFAEDVAFVVGQGLPEPARLEIKSHVTFGAHHIICVARQVSIGDYCWIGPGASIWDNDVHPLDLLQRRLPLGNMAAVKCAPVVIEDDVWVGVNATILKGVTLHHGSVVGAGAVVTESVPPFSVVAGNPAKVVAQLPGHANANDRLAAMAASP